ncbi:hypothetical protein KIH74_22725 [Kineosporia sp. J2-2]|uniref:Uncharacterized protein n=1 Tax=Kineosporia corallincola TaxID=2835133 RepID=A0ABS5TLQ0_9ACTN|nr:hypothetical protein [Kineosporia corallincola]MBT0771773.1 hypothetical protein [Kineosporia corallincola]
MNTVVEWAIRRPMWAGALMVVVAMLVLSRCSGTGAEPSAVATSAPEPTRQHTEEHVDPSEVASTQAATHNDDAERAATRFTQAWLAAGRRATWLAGMEPYATRELLNGLRSTDLTVVPDAHMSGPAEVLVDGPALYRYRIGLDDDSAVQVEVITDGDDPLVASIDRERE